MRGIILAGGRGTRLYPMTTVTSKHLLPVYDKPMVYYPLTTLMLAGIREILIISTPEDLPQYERLFGSGEKWGLSLSYAEQPKPGGIAQAYIIGADFVGSEWSALILGDNIFYGSGLPKLLAEAVGRRKGATVFAYLVKNAQRYGVVELDATGRPISIEEKPDRPKSPWAITGLYFYDNRAPDFVSRLRPSTRGELEISDLNRAYLEEGALHVETLGRGYAWLDAGTADALMQAATFVQIVEERQRHRIGSPEEVAFRMKFIDRNRLIALAREQSTSAYGSYLEDVAREERPR